MLNVVRWVGYCTHDTITHDPLQSLILFLLSLPTHGGIITSDLKMAGQIFMEFGMNIVPFQTRSFQ
jgi:hypothetical protein